MQELTKAQKARHAIREFKTITDALALRGFYRPSGKMGKALEFCLKNLRPEIYGSMNDPRVVELKGLEYVIDRLPRGVEECTKIILTEEDPFENTAFEKIEPFKRRRTAYRVSKNEICIVISRGLSEIYDILTHITFLYAEAKKIYSRMIDDSGNTSVEWKDLEKSHFNHSQLGAGDLDQSIWNLSLLLGRPYQEARETYEYLEKTRKEHSSNNGLFSLIYYLGHMIETEKKSLDDALVIYLTPSLMNIIGHQRYGKKWAADIKQKLLELGLEKRPLHIVSANLHSVVNSLYGFSAVREPFDGKDTGNVYDFFDALREQGEEVIRHALGNGLYEIPDTSGTHIDCQLIDLSRLESIPFHPGLDLKVSDPKGPSPVILVMDYAFGAQAFELMENLLKPIPVNGSFQHLDIRSISIMGKAGILPGKQGDIILASAHVFEGTSDNYIVENDIAEEDFSDDIDVYIGPITTVLGTSLQNRDVLEKFQSDWQAVGLEMEGGHYQRAISAAIIKGNLSKDVKLRYAYYASDNPLSTGATLAAGAMGSEGVKPTYMITLIILQKILNPPFADDTTPMEGT